MAKFALRRRKELLAYFDVRIHRAADIEEEEHLDAIAPLGHEVRVEPPGILRGALDRCIEIELLGHAFASESAEPSECDLDVARVELDRIVEIRERPLIPDLDRASAAAALLTDANAFGVVAVRAERTRARGADPLRPALMTRALLGEPLSQRLHELVPSAKGFD